MQYASLKPDRRRLNDDSHNKLVYNGYTLDDELDGFRTLNVSGREVLSYEYSTNDRPKGQAGVVIDGKKLPGRLITVQYQMLANDALDLQLQYRRLHAILDTDQDVIVRFTDTPDVQFYGQIVGFDDVPPHSNSVVSSLEIFCQDPYLYDRQETVLSTANGRLRKDRNGFYQVPNYGSAPTRFKFKNKSRYENGFLSITSDNSYFAVGDPQELDAVKVPNNKMVFNEEMHELARWKLNEIQPPVKDGKAVGGFTHDPGKYGATISVPVNEPWKEGEHWHGPSAYLPLEKDALNESFAPSFHAKFRLALKSFDTKKQGYRVVTAILDQNKEFMFWSDNRDGSAIYGGTTGLFMRRDRNGNDIKVAEYGKPMFDGWHEFRKRGNSVVFSAYDNTQNKNKWSREWSTYLPEYDAQGRYASYVYIWMARLREIPFYDNLTIAQMRVFKYYNNKYGNVTNLFGPGDVFELDTSTGRRSINGVPHYQALDPLSDVAMELKPGINTLSIQKSSWNPYQDEIEIRFRQRYI